MISNCVFCKIVAGEIPCDKVYEDDLVLCFLDIAPLTLGHALVIPKEHHTSATTLTDEVAARMFQVAPKIGQALVRATDGGGFNLLLSNGACAGQVVPHAHLHVIPRCNDDGVILPTRTAAYESPEQKAEILAATVTRLGA